MDLPAYLVGVKMFLAGAVMASVLLAAPAWADDPGCPPNPYGGVGCAPTGGGGVYVPPPVPDNPPRAPAVQPFGHAVFVPPPMGQDHRPCVSLREYRGAKYGWTRLETERRWEVVGKGRLSDFPAFGLAVAYPACGYTKDQALYGVVYKHDELRVTVQYKELGAVPHGRP